MFSLLRIFKKNRESEFFSMIFFLDYLNTVLFFNLQKGNYNDALHRYSYTLKKFPKDPSELAIMPDNVKAIIEMKFNLLLNLARCHRKLEVISNRNYNYSLEGLF